MGRSAPAFGPEVNPEGLYGLLVAVAAELGEMGVELSGLIPVEMRRVPGSGDSGD